MVNYKNFLIIECVNKLKHALLLEGYITYSNEFNYRLIDIRDRSDIADHLIDMGNEYFRDDEIKQSFIDLTDSPDEVTFLPFNKAGYDDEEVNFKKKGRSKIKIGRLVKSLLKLSGRTFSDKEIEKFVNLFKSETKSVDEEFKIVNGSDIPYWYNQDNYHEGYGNGRGTLSNSCMKDSSEDFFDIYKNSPNCSMLILTMNVKGNPLLIGRALVWKLSKSPCEAKYFMDRVYSMRDSDLQKFKKYADDNGWLMKFHNNSDKDDGMIFTFKSKTVYGKVEVDVNGKCSEYPYVDTLKFLNSRKNKISNIGYKGGFLMEGLWGDVEKCPECDGSGVGCSYCSGTGKVDCADCQGSGYNSCKSCVGGFIRGKECKKCDDGSVKCLKCSDGKIKCSECGGSLCPSCTGLPVSLSALNKLKEDGEKEMNSILKGMSGLD